MTEYRYEAHTRVWRKVGYRGIDYSDGTAIEHRLLAALRQCEDVSCGSDELALHITDWPSEYHFSPVRANLLRPLGIGRQHRVAELGCGFGALTRYLGETGAGVSAVEGSRRRAEGAAERCRDLPNVRVYCENLAELEVPERFDFVTLIGVLEYAPVFIPGADPVVACLEKARSLLAPGGILVLAIENQLGLKYFAACEEDHTARPFFGVHGLYDQDTPITFGKRALIERLRSAGFGTVTCLYPFPDYKLPSVILSEVALEHPELRVGDLLIRPLVGMRGGEWRSFHENLAWQPVAENRLLADLANSFLILARPAGQRPLPSLDWLSLSYATGRRRPYWTQTRICQEAGRLHVQKSNMHPGLLQDSAPFRLYPMDAPYVEGQLWVTGLWKRLSEDASWTVLGDWFRPWLQFLRQHAMPGSQAESLDFLLPTRFVDCTPFNLIQDETGKLVYIDAEWEAGDPVPAAWVVVRGLFYSVYGAPLPTTLGEIKASDFIDKVLRASDVNLPDAAWPRICDLENLFQTSVHATARLHRFDVLLHSPLKVLSPLLVSPGGCLPHPQLNPDPSTGNPAAGQRAATMFRAALSRARRKLKTASTTALAIFRHERKLRLLLAAARTVRTGGLAGLGLGIRTFVHAHVTYERWIALHDTITEADQRAIRVHIAAMALRPLISILMPTFNTPEMWLRRAIDSVRAQLYTHWELCIVDDASTAPRVWAVLEEYAKLDDRIHIARRNQNGHISAASNDCLRLACGEFVALFDHDDELAPHALYMVVAAINARPSVGLIYSDEDKIDATGQRLDPYFKPDWNPDLLTAQNVICHLSVYRTALVRAVGGFREGLEGAQDWDLALRVSEKLSAHHVHHIPHVLYHWRTFPGSTAGSIESKPYAIAAGLAAVRAHIERVGRSATVSLVTETYLRVQYNVPTPPPMVSIIIPTRNGINYLRRAIDSLVRKARYTCFEILVVDNESDESDTLEYLDSLETAGIAKILRYGGPFNFSAINNFAVRSARGEVLCLVNNDVEAISDGWLEEMVSLASRTDIGAVGAMLYYPNNRIQHAGVVIGLGGVAGHPYLGSPRGTHGYMGRARVVQNFSAVTGACLAVRRAVFEEVGGMDEINLPVAFNDVDFCLRLMERGYRNLWTPFAEFYHHESASRGKENTPEKQMRFHGEVEYMKARWGHVLGHDAAYNPNLTLDAAWPYLAQSPRTHKPWRAEVG